MTEQAEAEILETSEQAEAQDHAPQSESISDVLSNALKGKDENPQDPVQTDKVESAEQVTDKPEETLYGEIVIDEAKKLSFKSEKEFQQWIEKHPFLKDKLLMQSDYTRKTSQVAEERKKFLAEKQQHEEQIAKESGVWGGTKPTTEDMNSMGELWNVFQHGSDRLAGQIQSFLKDVSLIAKGQVPTGPLAARQGEQTDFAQDSTLISTRRELSQMKEQLEKEKRERETRDNESSYRSALGEVNSWLSAKKEQGVEITDDERNQMARFSGLKDAEGNRISLDEMHKLALAAMGRTEKEAMKKVFTGAKALSKKTPNQPTSKASASASGAPKDIEGILKQGLEDLKT